jgi:hypothetical protein
LIKLRVTVVKSDKLVGEARDSSGTLRKRNVHHWKPLQATASEDLEDFMCAVVNSNL